MTALGAEGRRFESCLPDANFRQFQELPASPSANNCGTQQSGTEQFRTVSPRIVPGDVQESFPEGHTAESWAAMVRASEALDWGGPSVPLYPDKAEPGDPVHYQKPGTIYFIGGDTGAIKIGFTTTLDVRLRRLRANSPIPLGVLASKQGVAWDERAYHLLFQRHRLHGEWFARAPEILAEIDRISPTAFRKGASE